MQQKVILINLPPVLSYNYNNIGAIYPATGILLIGTIMKSRGIKLQVIDGAVKKNYEEIVLGAIDKDTRIIGFSVMTSQVPLALRLSRLIKMKYPDILIVWGGVHPILFPEQTISNPYVDIVVTGEGAETATDLIKFIEEKISLKEVMGIASKEASGKVFFTNRSQPDDIDNLPQIDYSILEDIDVYLHAESVYQREISTDHNEAIKALPILTGLGCCYKCQFCINVILKRKYRFRSAQDIIDEVKRLQERYAANTFIFYDEDFFISKQRLMDFLDLIEKGKLNFYWRAWARVDYFRENYLNRDLILRMEKNGLRSIVMGAESGSQRILDLIEKEIKAENTPYSAQLLKGTKITPRYSFIVGLDSEEKNDTLKTYKLCAELIRINRRVDLAIFIFRYYPGSPIFNRIVKKYKIELPQKVQDWENFLSEEGYLKIEKMSWVWPGFLQTATLLNKEIGLLSRMRNMNNIVINLIKKMIYLRLKNTFTKLPVEMYVFELIKIVYHKYLNIKHPFCDLSGKKLRIELNS